MSKANPAGRRGDRPDLTPRNERIRELARDPKVKTAGRILKVMFADYPNLTRNVIVGVLQRSPDRPDDAGKRGREEAAHASRIAARERGPGSNGFSYGGGTKGRKPETDAPKSPSQQVWRFETRPLPDANPVSLMQHTGCTWPHDDGNGGLVYCNLPRCKVQAYGALPVTVAYCAQHWDLRRASKYTRVLA